MFNFAPLGNLDFGIGSLGAGIKPAEFNPVSANMEDEQAASRRDVSFNRRISSFSG